MISRLKKEWQGDSIATWLDSKGEKALRTKEHERREGKEERGKDKAREKERERCGVVPGEESRVGRRASITSFPRLKGAGQWGTPGRLTWPKAAGYLDRFECQELKRDRENRWRWTKGVTLRKKKKSIATLLFSVFGVVSRLLAAVDLLKPTSSINTKSFRLDRLARTFKFSVARTNARKTARNTS